MKNNCGVCNFRAICSLVDKDQDVYVSVDDSPTDFNFEISTKFDTIQGEHERIERVLTQMKEIGLLLCEPGDELSIFMSIKRRN